MKIKSDKNIINIPPINFWKKNRAGNQNAIVFQFQLIYDWKSYKLLYVGHARHFCMKLQTTYQTSCYGFVGVFEELYHCVIKINYTRD